MGIGEVFTAIPAFLKKRKHLKHLIRTKRPDAVVLVDFGDFNMPLARFTHRLGIPVVYYIPPKAWAWRPSRAKKIAKTTTAVASIFPFAAEFYRKCWGKCGVCRASVTVGLCPNRSELYRSASCDSV